MSEMERKSEEESVDDLVQRAILSGDPTIVFADIRSTISAGHRKAYRVAKSIYETWKHWPSFQKQGVDDDWENVAPGLCGLSLDQCSRYRDIYRDIFLNEDVPASVKPYLARKTMRTQYALLSPAREGDFDDDVWDEIADAVTEREVKAIIRRERGTEPTSSKTRLILVENRDGRVRAKEGKEGQYVEVAVFRSSREDIEGDDYEHRIRRKAIERLRRCGILQSRSGL